MAIRRVVIDTSALLKHYIMAQGSEEVALLLVEADAVVLAPHCRLEMMSAFNQLLLNKKIDRQRLLNLETAVGSVRVCCFPVRCLGATTHNLYVVRRSNNGSGPENSAIECLA